MNKNQTQQKNLRCTLMFTLINRAKQKRNLEMKRFLNLFVRLSKLSQDEIDYDLRPTNVNNHFRKPNHIKI